MIYSWNVVRTWNALGISSSKATRLVPPFGGNGRWYTTGLSKAFLLSLVVTGEWGYVGIALLHKTKSRQFVFFCAARSHVKIQNTVAHRTPHVLTGSCCKSPKICETKQQPCPTRVEVKHVPRVAKVAISCHVHSRFVS